MKMIKYLLSLSFVALLFSVNGMNNTDSLTTRGIEPLERLPINPLNAKKNITLPERFSPKGKSEAEVKEAVTTMFANKMTASFPDLDKMIQEKLDKLDDPNTLPRDYNAVIDGSTTIILDAATTNDEFTDMNGYDFKNDQQIQNVAKAKEVLKKIKETGNLIKFLTTENLVQLPVGLSKTINNVTYVMGINSIQLHPQYAELEIYLGIEIPQRDMVLHFGAKDIKFSYNGGIVGDATLGLIADFAHTIGSNKSLVVWKGINDTADQGCFVKIDCNGFQALSVDAQIHFSRDLILPVDLQDKPIADVTKRVIGTFSFYTENGFNDIICAVSMPRFCKANLTNIVFNLELAIIDMSDLSNEPGMEFPAGYFDPDPPSGPSSGATATANAAPIGEGSVGITNTSSPSQSNNTGNTGTNGMNSGPYPNTWRGVYIKAIDISLPSVFKKKTAPNARIKVGGEHVIVDAMGVSGYFYAEGLIPISGGKMTKWKYSLDHFGITLVKNKVKGFGFGGQLVVPITKESTPFEYIGKVDDSGNFTLTVTAQADMEWPLWQVAQVNLLQGSHVDIAIIDDEFKPSATLHGSLSISASLSNGSAENPDGKKLNLVGVHFTSLVLQTEQPYISAEKVYFSSGVIGADLAIFPISIDSIAMNNDGGNANLRFRLRVKFMKDVGNFAGETFARLVGKLDPGEETHLWKYDKLVVEKISIDVDVSGFKMVGSIEFFQEDQIYGSGFAGYLCVEIDKIKLRFQANAIFGAKENDAGESFRYWYFDAKVGFSPGITVYPGFTINGIGGGAYHHMVLTGLAPDDYDGPGVVNSSTSCDTDMNSGSAGTRLLYQPWDQIKLGLKISIDFRIADTGSEGVVNGTACFEMAFTNNWGLAYIAISGSGTLLREMSGKETAMLERIEKLGNQNGTEVSQTDKDAAEAPMLSVKVSFLMQLVFIEIPVQTYDGPTTTLKPGFHGNFKAYISVAQGRFRGTSQPAVYGCGGADIKITADEWHFYLGHYERISYNNYALHYVSVGLYGEAVNFNVMGYFMLGNDIPGAPPLPPKVKQKFGINTPPTNARDANASKLANGTGFALGAHINFSVWKEFRFFGKKRAGADILAGFDIALIKYGQNTYCKENGGSQVWQDFGAKRWRASGNLYCYVGGKVQKWKRRKKYWKTMFGINVGILVQGTVPNPVWVKGKIRLPVVPDVNFEKGKKCTVYNN